MESITETQIETPIEYCCGKPIVKPSFSIEDFMNMSDNVIKEEQLIKAFQSKLNKIPDLTEYAAKLTDMKKAKQIKLTALKMIALGNGITQEKWDADIKIYLDKIGYPYETVSYIETISVKDKATNTLVLKDVAKIKITNNLKSADTDNTKEIITTILDKFALSDELKNDFTECLESLKTVKSEEVIADHVIKANSELWTVASNLTKNRLADQVIDLDTNIKTLESSIAFISWKLKQIGIRKNNKKQNKLNEEFINMSEMVSAKLNSDTKFASLHGLVKKYSLNTRPKRA